MSDRKRRPAGGAPRESATERRARRAEIDDPEVVLAAALHFLETRQRAVAEVRRRLTQAGYRADLIEGVIARLGELGMLDDEAFARAWVESRDRAHPRGEHVLMLELRQKGIEATVIAATLRERRDAATRWADGAAEPGAETPPGADEAAARRLLERHRRSLERIPDLRARRQRAYALLARHGFGPDIARELTRALE